jgi:phosphoribosylaminoimidazolecarboxamide formyltransferase / IMP cyclohydrolase
MIKIKDLPPPQDLYPIRRALISVFDKTDLIPFARSLAEYGVEILSTGGSAKALREAGIDVRDVSAVTGSPEILDGRVKSLHPSIHGGILARRTDQDDLRQLDEHGIEPIDMVVVNLYPFQSVVASPEVSRVEAVENIDIGGPGMVRAAAKNADFVAVLTRTDQYAAVLEELEANEGALSLKTRRSLAAAAFDATAAYDRAIADYLQSGAGGTPSEGGTITWSGDGGTFSAGLSLHQALRYGENPHQKAALFGDPSRFFRQLHGKELSFNNIIDLSAALQLIDEFRDSDPTCAILKHTNPCGVAVAETSLLAWERAFATDRQSPFGGIVVLNRPLDMETAEAIDRIFSEIIIAPAFEEGVLTLLMQKANRRLIEHLAPASTDASPDVRSVIGGMLVQERDPVIPPFAENRQRCRVATRREPDPQEWRDLDFAWRVCKHVKSNAIVYARDGATLGIGAGQMSRIDSSEIAASKAGKSELDLRACVVASDAFFPFADGLIEAAARGATAVIQPGGSVRDEEVVAAADERDLAMVFTGERHFRH